MRVLRLVVRIAAGLVALVALVFLAARWHDGPLGPIPGGALASGEVIEQPVSDWSFAADVAEVELQLDSEERSRTVWILVHEGRAYIPCSLGYPPGKRWHHQAVKDGRATMRIDGRRYPVVLVKTDDPALGPRLRPEVERKYGSVPGDSGVWIFEITSRGA